MLSLLISSVWPRLNTKFLIGLVAVFLGIVGVFCQESFNNQVDQYFQKVAEIQGYEPQGIEKWYRRWYVLCTTPGVNPIQQQDIRVGISCLLFLIPCAGMFHVDRPYAGTFAIFLTLSSFMADYGDIYSMWSVVDRYVAICGAFWTISLYLQSGPNGVWWSVFGVIIGVGSLERSRNATTTEEWVQRHVVFHVSMSLLTFWLVCRLQMVRTNKYFYNSDERPWHKSFWQRTAPEREDSRDVTVKSKSKLTVTVKSKRSKASKRMPSSSPKGEGSEMSRFN